MEPVHVFSDLPPHDRVATLRRARGETLEQFGALIGKVSKGVMSELERGLRLFTPEQALAVEQLSREIEGHAIDAADLNEVVALARHGLEAATAGDLSATGQTTQLSGGAA
jgi:transcriptional regulator with XRE-family HTH domain